MLKTGALVRACRQAGILTVTVPGTVWGWDEVLRRFGTLTFKETLQPAIDYAENGFPVSERVANDWRLPQRDSGRFRATPAGAAPRWTLIRSPRGTSTAASPRQDNCIRSPDLARTFRLLQRNGRDGFYKGEIARAIVAKSTAVGGTMTLDDLANYTGEWVDAATTTYHGYDVLTLPPPAQTWASDEMLNILEACVPQWAAGQTLASIGPANPNYWHFVVEAKKLAYTDLYAYNADPHFASVPVARLLSKSYAQSLCGRVDPHRATATAPGAHVDVTGDTIVLSAADRWGNMVSWVNSNFAAFGSGLTVPGYGFILHNRGGLFTLDPKSPNVLAPGKRPFNTLSAGFVMQNNRPLMTVTLMGGDMQAQGIAQVLLNVLDLGANVQAATDMARFRHSQVPNMLSLESKLFALVGADLQAMGHKVQAINGADVGGYQAIMFTPDPEPAVGGSAEGIRASTERGPITGRTARPSDTERRRLAAAKPRSHREAMVVLRRPTPRLPPVCGTTLPRTSITSAHGLESRGEEVGFRGGLVLVRRHLMTDRPGLGRSRANPMANTSSVRTRRASGSGRGLNDGPPRWSSPCDRCHCCGSPSCSNCIPDTDTDRRADAQQGPDGLREIGIDHEREPSGHLRPPRQLPAVHEQDEADTAWNQAEKQPRRIERHVGSVKRPVRRAVVQRPRRDGEPPRSIRRHAPEGFHVRGTWECAIRLARSGRGIHLTQVCYGTATR